MDVVELKDGNKIVKPERQIKILGFLLNSRMSLDSHLNAVVGKINAMIVNLKPIAKYM